MHTPGSRFVTIRCALARFESGRSSCWSIRRSPLRSSVHPIVRCLMMYGSSCERTVKEREQPERAGFGEPSRGLARALACAALQLECGDRGEKRRRTSR
eukprot:6182002-Pleurochrysis_carterae.AAC.4